MSAADTDLFPEDLIEDALAPQRPDEDDFAVGVRLRVDERRGKPRGGNARRNDSSEAGSDEPAQHRAWPTWLRRAAAILPPGVIDVALLGKLSGAAGGAATKTVPVSVLLLAPWAILLVTAAALVGAMRLTRELDAKNSAGMNDRRLKRAIRTGPAALFSGLVFLLPLSLLIFALDRGRLWIAAGIFVLTAMTIAGFVLTLSRRGIADRHTVAKVVYGGLAQFVGIGGMLPIFLKDSVGPVTLYGLPALIAWGAIGVGLMGDPKLRANMKWAWPFIGAVGFLMPFLLTLVVQVPFGKDVEELEAWVEGFDHPSSALMHWEALGHASAVLGDERFDALDLSRARAALLAPRDDDKRRHPRTDLGAWRAGLLTSSDLGQHRRAPILLENEFRDGEVKTYLRDGDLLELIALVDSGELGPERLAILAAGVEAALPDPDAHGAVAATRIALDCADVLGIEDFVERRRDDILAILRNCWDSEGRSYCPPGGFGNWLDPDEHSRLSDKSPFVASSGIQTLEAIELMLRVGVPEGVDLSLTDRYLTDEMLYTPRREALIGDVTSSFARHLLRRSFEIPLPSLTDRLAREAIFFAALVLVAMSLWVVWRAPMPAPVEEGPLARNVDGART